MTKDKEKDKVRNCYQKSFQALTPIFAFIYSLFSTNLATISSFLPSTISPVSRLTKLKLCK